MQEKRKQKEEGEEDKQTKKMKMFISREWKKTKKRI